MLSSMLHKTVKKSQGHRRPSPTYFLWVWPAWCSGRSTWRSAFARGRGNWAWNSTRRPLIGVATAIISVWPRWSKVSPTWLPYLELTCNLYTWIISVITFTLKLTGWRQRFRSALKTHLFREAFNIWFPGVNRVLSAPLIICNLWKRRFTNWIHYYYNIFGDRKWIFKLLLIKYGDRYLNSYLSDYLSVFQQAGWCTHQVGRRRCDRVRWRPRFEGKVWGRPPNCRHGSADSDRCDCTATAPIESRRSPTDIAADDHRRSWVGTTLPPRRQSDSALCNWSADLVALEMIYFTLWLAHLI